MTSRARRTFIEDQLAGVAEQTEATLRQNASKVLGTSRADYDSVGRSAVAQDLGQRLLDALTTGSCRPCTHLDASTPTAMFWTPEQPGELCCRLCSISYVFTRDQPGQPAGLCDGCQAPQPARPLVVAVGPVTILAGVCNECATSIGSGA